jgi:hypothetical protein
MKYLIQRAYIIGPIIIFIALVIMVNKVDQDNVTYLYEQETQIEEVIMRYSIACYAQEGAYPPNLEYLEDNYGLIMDQDKYFYYYSLFASNVMPDVEVVAKNGR